MMIRITVVLALGLGMTSAVPVLAGMPLRPVSSTELPPQLGRDQQLWGESGQRGDRSTLIQAIAHSLDYLQTPKAVQAYRNYKVPGISRDRVRRSLRRFQQLLRQAKSPAELEAAVKREFVFYQAIGKDGQGTVDFTGYFEPTYVASRTPTREYRYPLYRAPVDLKQWPNPHPTRLELEGKDGLQGARGPLRGLELVWLRDRLEAFLVQVQGSARLQLIQGGTMTVGYAGKTNYPYTSIGKELVQEGKFQATELTLPRLLQYFQDNPQERDRYLPRNQSFVFFRETHGSPATGSLGVPVTPNRSIATDKTLMPPGALALIQTQLPAANASGSLNLRSVSRFTLDQDTGSAIKGPGRVDVFMGTGSAAKAKAGLINAPGQLYYLLLR